MVPFEIFEEKGILEEEEGRVNHEGKHLPFEDYHKKVAWEVEQIEDKAFEGKDNDIEGSSHNWVKDNYIHLRRIQIG